MDYAERCSGETMTQKLFIAALLFVALISSICTAAEMGPASAPLGRLFFSPSQRAELDRARHAPPVSPPQPAVQVVAKPVARPSLPSPEIVTVNGIVQRSDGQSTVWINNRPVSDQEESTTAIKRRGEGGRITLQIPESTRHLQLKVGQRADLSTGEINEDYKKSSRTDLPKYNNVNDPTPATEPDDLRKKRAAEQSVPQITVTR